MIKGFLLPSFYFKMLCGEIVYLPFIVNRLEVGENERKLCTFRFDTFNVLMLQEVMLAAKVKGK